MQATGDCVYVFDCQTARRFGVSCKESKGDRPLFCRWARGVPSVFAFRSPKKNRGGWRADKAHGLDYSRPAREFRGSRASPDRRALG